MRENINPNNIGGSIYALWSSFRFLQSTMKFLDLRKMATTWLFLNTLTWISYPNIAYFVQVFYCTFTPWSKASTLLTKLPGASFSQFVSCKFQMLFSLPSVFMRTLCFETGCLSSSNEVPSLLCSSSKHFCSIEFRDASPQIVSLRNLFVTCSVSSSTNQKHATIFESWLLSASMYLRSCTNERLRCWEVLWIL